MIIESYINTGNSFPVIISQNNKKYFVKLRAGMSSKFGLISEWIGNKLGCELGIATQSPCWFTINESVEFRDLNIEVRELVEKSFGTNIGFKFKENVQTVSSDVLTPISEDELAEIFLFDLVMRNIDRSPENINLMEVDGKIYSVDYESSLFVQEALESNKLIENPAILTCFRTNPLYQDLSSVNIEAFITKLGSISMHDILVEIPDHILSENQRDHIVRYFAEQMQQNWSLHKTLAKLKGINKFSNTEIVNKRKRNQQKFKDTLKSYSSKKDDI